jgi:uncharacterized protein YkwD
MVLRILRIALLISVSATPALACTRPTGSNAAISASRIDQGYLSQAILGEVNYQRCRAGRAPLSLAPQPLTRVAEGHSAWMAGTGRMSHTGGRASGRTLSDRARRSGLTVRTFAENLAFLPRYRFGGRPFRVSDRHKCQFRTLNGREVAPHTYGSLAREVVVMWMQSPGHRRTLLSPKLRRMSAAASLSQEGYCGRYYVTQMFIG